MRRSPKILAILFFLFTLSSANALDLRKVQPPSAGIDQTTYLNSLSSTLQFNFNAIQQSQVTLSLATFELKANKGVAGGLASLDANAKVPTAETYADTSIWTAWNPTITVAGGTAPTFTDVFVSRYKIVGKICYWYIVWGNASGGTAGSGTGAVKFALPVVISANAPLSGNYPPTIGFGNMTSTGLMLYVAVPSSVATAGFFNGPYYLKGNDFSDAVRGVTASGFYEID